MVGARETRTVRVFTRRVDQNRTALRKMVETSDKRIDPPGKEKGNLKFSGKG